MRTLFDTDEEEVAEGTASEITLSTASLLGIFFGLVLICGVFFGFGYSMGRGTGTGSSAKALENSPAETDETATAANPPAPTEQREDAQASTKTAQPPAVTRAKPAEAVAPDAASEDAPGNVA